MKSRKHCSICGEAGHTKTTCLAEFLPRATAVDGVAVTPPTAPERCPTCDREGCPMFPTPPVHEEEPRDKCPGCVAMYDCDTHRRAREDGMRAAAARWAKVAPLIERLRVATQADDDDPGDVNHALAALLAATEATP